MDLYKDMESRKDSTAAYIPLWEKYLEEWELLNNEELGELVRAMLEYAFGSEDGTAPLQGAGRYLWPRQRADIDYAVESYQKKVAAGRKGGRGKKAQREGPEASSGEQEENAWVEVEEEKQEKAEESREKQEKAEESREKQEKADESREKQKKAEESREKQERVIQYNKQKQNQNHNHNHNHNQPQPQKQPQDQGEAVVVEKEQAEFSLGRQVVSLFYRERQDLPRPEFIPRQTLEKAEKLGQNYPSSAIAAVFRKSKEGFLNGGGEKGWTASLSWLLDDRHFRDVLEGKYDWAHAGNSSGGSGVTPKKQTMAQTMTRRVEQGSAGLGEYERQAIRRMLEEARQEGLSSAASPGAGCLLSGVS